MSAKFLITSEFNFIQEVSENDLSNFPFENPLLLENKTLKFLRSLINGQLYRNTEIDKFIGIDKQQYPINFPDAITLPNNEDEYQFFFHKRTPGREELSETTLQDNISQFLLNNNIDEDRISEIRTCYEDECAGTGRFQELYILRPLYVQFLVLKNISNSPIRFKGLKSIADDGVLYKTKDIATNDITKFPEFIIEPSQNIIILIGLFLSQFKEIPELKSNIVTSIYIPDQIQHLQHGSLEENQEIEFIGPSLVPKKLIIEYQGQELTSQIHDFSFSNVYWVHRHWQCGSCPHLFLIKNSELKYQGEIFSVRPNQIQIERIIIPNFVSELVIAELEQEITFINYIKKNELLQDSEIVINEGATYSIMVYPDDCIELEGKYTLNLISSGTLPRNKKCELIEKFKIDYAKRAILQTTTCHISKC